jgi:glycosyltransferase involved in cell wall biosynthesis
MKIAWNAIVKNEAARIERCVNSLISYVDCAVVMDTGSSDRTTELIFDLFSAAHKQVELRYAPFVNFEQARNLALAHARNSALAWDYLLLADADMELAATDPDWRAKLNGGLAYDMRQVSGSLSYYNRRLLSRQSDAVFVGVTHEYLDVLSAGVIDGAYFIDHADGSNRTDKVQRDIALLERALVTETRPGLVERYHFYLAQSYFDAGEYQLAAAHYEKRVSLGGFDEERAFAQRQLARCQAKMGDSKGFVWEMLRAYSMRPQRVEPLCDLAQSFRKRGDNHVSLLFSEAGLALPYPKDDKLFVTDVRDLLQEEFSICAYYDARRRPAGAKLANKLALAGNEQARFNLLWYLQPLAAAVPSFTPQRLAFEPPADWVATNPSVTNHAGEVKVLVRTVNYTITPEGHYRIRAADGSITGDSPIRTRNFIGTLDGQFSELALPLNWPVPPQYQLVRGFEDSRLFQHGQELWTLSTVRELTPQGWCEQVLAPLECGPAGWRYADTWQQIRPGVHRSHEKNWMPWSYGDALRLVYRLGTLLDLHGKTLACHEPRWKVDHISGGSQVVAIGDSMYLALVHEARPFPDRANRYYQHRFVILDNHGKLDGISPPFFFHDRQIEFAAGLAYFPERRQLMVSYGVRDCEAWLATMAVDEVIKFVYRDVL